MKVVVLGASEKPERYAHKAMKSLEANHHQVYLVNPNLTEIEGRAVHPDLASVKEKVHTLTMYVNPRISADMGEEIAELGPKRVIFNPGSENPQLARFLAERGIQSEEACTLVLLNTNQF